MPTGEPLQWEGILQSGNWHKIEPPPSDLVYRYPATSAPHTCKQAYTHIYDFTWGKTSYTKILKLKCSDLDCPQKDEGLLINKQNKVLPRFWC
jgi:hypothetical protein